MSDDPNDKVAILSIRDPDDDRSEPMLEVPTVPVLGGSVAGTEPTLLGVCSGHAEAKDKPVLLYDAANPVPLSLVEQVWEDQLPGGIQFSPLDAVCGILDSDLYGDQQKRDMILKAARQSYKNKDKASRQVELYPELEQAIEKRLDELDAGIIWGTEAERWSDSYKKALREATLEKGKIGGSKSEQEDYFKRVIASHPATFWLEGCAPPHHTRSCRT